MINALFAQHGIHPHFHPGMLGYVLDGIKPTGELKTRLETCENYQACLEDLFYHFQGEAA